MVAQAWDGISKEMIKKSFLVCGQTKGACPEQITCLKEGHSAHDALEEVKRFWNKSAEEFDAEGPKENQEEIDEEEDPTIVISDGSDDEDVDDQNM